MLARIDVVGDIKRGAVVPVHIAILHPMETGYRFDVNGRVIPKNVINTLTCRYQGEIVFRAEMGSGMVLRIFGTRSSPANIVNRL